MSLETNGTIRLREAAAAFRWQICQSSKRFPARFLRLTISRPLSLQDVRITNTPKGVEEACHAKVPRPLADPPPRIGGISCQIPVASLGFCSPWPSPSRPPILQAAIARLVTHPCTPSTPNHTGDPRPCAVPPGQA